MSRLFVDSDTQTSSGFDSEDDIHDQNHYRFGLDTKELITAAQTIENSKDTRLMRMYDLVMGRQEKKITEDKIRRSLKRRPIKARTVAFAPFEEEHQPMISDTFSEISADVKISKQRKSRTYNLKAIKQENIILEDKSESSETSNELHLDLKKSQATVDPQTLNSANLLVSQDQSLRSDAKQ